VQALYLISVWLHILAATVWIGGLFFIVLVVVPWLKRGHAGSMDAGAFLQETGARFRYVGWICFAVIAMTGTFNLSIRGVRWSELVSVAWWTGPFGGALAIKLLLFALVLAVSFVHDFRVGPRATEAMRLDPRAPDTTALRKRASLLGRLNGLLALALVALGVVLVRGWPW